MGPFPKPDDLNRLYHGQMNYRKGFEPKRRNKMCRPMGGILKSQGTDDYVLTVLQISHGRLPAVLHIGQRFVQTGVSGGMLAVNPRPKGLENRLFLLETHLFPFS